jgi:hypothetical protein
MNDWAFTRVACGHLLEQLEEPGPLYRTVSLWRKTKPYLVGMRQDLSKDVLAAQAMGFDQFGIGRFLWAEHPALWSLCNACHGTSATCLDCGGAGFRMGQCYEI